MCERKREAEKSKKVKQIVTCQWLDTALGFVIEFIKHL